MPMCARQACPTTGPAPRVTRQVKPWGERFAIVDTAWSLERTGGGVEWNFENHPLRDAADQVVTYDTAEDAEDALAAQTLENLP